jgi:uncharacterized protein
MSISDELRKLHELRESGAISDAEFADAKARLLEGQHDGGQAPVYTSSSAGDLSANLWGMILHLSLLLEWTLVGIVVPIVIWQVKKDKYPIIDEHGKNAVNWIISLALYFFLSFLLTFVLIGVVGFFIFGILAVVFPIIAAIKANNGEVWRYPLSIRFFT